MLLAMVIDHSDTPIKLVGARDDYDGNRNDALLRRDSLSPRREIVSALVNPSHPESKRVRLSEPQ